MALLKFIYLQAVPDVPDSYGYIQDDEPEVDMDPGSLPAERKAELSVNQETEKLFRQLHTLAPDQFVQKSSTKPRFFDFKLDSQGLPETVQA